MAACCAKPATKMSVTQFTNWLNSMDSDGNGVITQPELEKAIKSLGLWFSNCRTKKAMAAADTNYNGLIDNDEELQQLIVYAQKNLGISIVKD